MVAAPAASGLPTANVAVSFSLSSVTLAFCVAPPLLMFTSRNSIPTELSTIWDVGFNTHTWIVSSPTKLS